MREILFRGQTRRKGEKVRLDGSPVPGNWVYGGICYTKPNTCRSIIYQVEPDIQKFPVYADTVGQYIGITDKNGIKIFEGDIVKINIDDEDIYIVDYNAEEAIFEVTGQFNNICYNFSSLFGSEVEVIGNIHDNPELLETED